MENSWGQVSVNGVVIDLVGVDDPHHGFDEMPPPARRVPDAALRLGVALIMPGHTHGGQVCVPGWGRW